MNEKPTRCDCAVCKAREGKTMAVEPPVFETDLDRLKRERYEKQEQKRAPRIQVDQIITLNAWLIGVLIAFVASAIVSFNGITSVARFVGLSADWMAFLFFFFIELMYLLFLVAYLLLESRENENSGEALAGTIFFGFIAVAANAFHTLDYWQWAFTEPRAWAGVVLSVSAPIAIISASKMASRVIFARSLEI